MYEKAAFVFWTTLGLYLVTLFTVSYVGVYLTYVAIPFIALLGLAMLLAKPSFKSRKTTTELKSVVNKTTQNVSSEIEKIGKSIEEQADRTLVASLKMRIEVKKCTPVKNIIKNKKLKLELLSKKYVLSEICFDEYFKEKCDLEKDINTLEDHLRLLKVECEREAIKEAKELG